MRESDIMHESVDGHYWVARRISAYPAIAPIGSIYYRIFENKGTHSESTTFVTANLERAIATCDNMARVTSPTYRKTERAIARAERSIRKNVR
jgi:hypothetical protein